jgi:sugar/nucleoside kinase (ribokinase family)
MNAKIYMDCQAHSTSIEDPLTSQTVADVDVFSPNRDEALALTGETEIEASLEKLSKLTETVIIKNGAGDNFNCGFIYGQIKEYSLEDSLRIGNFCGGLSTQQYGGGSDTISTLKIKRLLTEFQS